MKPQPNEKCSYTIYELTHTSGLFYVGVTSGTLWLRLRGHITHSKNALSQSRGKLYGFMKNTKAEEWKMTSLEVVFAKRSEALEVEQSWIKKLYSNMCLNMLQNEFTTTMKRSKKRTEWWANVENKELWKKKRSQLTFKLPRTSIRVQCIETGEIWESMTKMLKDIDCKVSRKDLRERFLRGNGVAIIKGEQYKIIKGDL